VCSFFFLLVFETCRDDLDRRFHVSFLHLLIVSASMMTVFIFGASLPAKLVNQLNEHPKPKSGQQTIIITIVFDRFRFLFMSRDTRSILMLRRFLASLILSLEFCYYGILTIRHTLIM
jgi:hypothetical protein